jgi:hypothetical protein
VTPDGHGDSVRTFSDGSLMFVQPNECEMSLREFQRRLRRPRTGDAKTTSVDINGRPIVRRCHKVGDKKATQTSLPDDSIVYYSRQVGFLLKWIAIYTFASHCLLTKPKNDCLRKEIPKLKEHFPSGVEWAEEALGPNQPLDAINLWMGDELATSSMHKDHYENLFYVASGEKIFTVCPPANVAFLYEHKEYRTGAVQVNDTTRQWEVANMEEESKVHWIAPDVTKLQEENGSALKEAYPLLEHVRPMEIRVRAGEMLYLPSLWFHRVTQSCETVGINYWYEMKFDSPLWCYFSFLQQLQHCDDDEESTS